MLRTVRDALFWTGTLEPRRAPTCNLANELGFASGYSRVGNMLFHGDAKACAGQYVALLKPSHFNHVRMS